MTIEEIILAAKLEDYKDRTGDYKASRVPAYTDLIEPIPAPDKRKLPPATIAKYGLTRWQYWTLLDKQAGRCAICGAKPDKRALHVDHCHASRKVRGLVCHGCNLAIGFIKEDSETARAIADYLDKRNENALVGSIDAPTLQKNNVDFS